jgi:hypothetical protein
MNFFWTDKEYPLQCDGLQDKALLRSDALHAITILRIAGVPVSGGEVWVRRDSRLELTYNNWSIETGDSAEAS